MLTGKDDICYFEESDEQPIGLSPRQVADTLWGSVDLHDPTLTRIKYNDAAHSYDQGSITLGWPAVYDHVNETLAAHRVALKGNILDAGCGSGLVTRYMNHINNDDINLYGCDISESMLNLARKTEAYHDLRISNLYEMLPYRDGKFDLIIACGVLGYVDSNMPLIEFERLLRPGGSLVFAFRQEHFVHHDYQDVLDRDTCTFKTKSVEFMDPFPNDPNFRHVYRVSLLTKKPKTQKA